MLLFQKAVRDVLQDPEQVNHECSAVADKAHVVSRVGGWIHDSKEHIRGVEDQRRDAQLQMQESETQTETMHEHHEPGLLLHRWPAGNIIGGPDVGVGGEHLSAAEAMTQGPPGHKRSEVETAMEVPACPPTFVSKLGIGQEHHNSEQQCKRQKTCGVAGFEANDRAEETAATALSPTMPFEIQEQVKTETSQESEGEDRIQIWVSTPESLM